MWARTGKRQRLTSWPVARSKQRTHSRWPTASHRPSGLNAGYDRQSRRSSGRARPPSATRHTRSVSPSPRPSRNRSSGLKDKQNPETRSETRRRTALSPGGDGGGSRGVGAGVEPVLPAVRHRGGAGGRGASDRHAADVGQGQRGDGLVAQPLVGPDAGGPGQGGEAVQPLARLPAEPASA